MTISEMYTIARREARKVPAEDRDDVVQDCIVAMLPMSSPGLATVAARRKVQMYWRKVADRSRVAPTVSLDEEHVNDDGSIYTLHDTVPDTSFWSNVEAVCALRERLARKLKYLSNVPSRT